MAYLRPTTEKGLEWRRRRAVADRWRELAAEALAPPFLWALREPDAFAEKRKAFNGLGAVLRTNAAGELSFDFPDGPGGVVEIHSTKDALAPNADHRVTLEWVWGAGLLMFVEPADGGPVSVFGFGGVRRARPGGVGRPRMSRVGEGKFPTAADARAALERNWVLALRRATVLTGGESVGEADVRRLFETFNRLPVADREVVVGVNNKLYITDPFDGGTVHVRLMGPTGTVYEVRLRTHRRLGPVAVFVLRRAPRPALAPVRVLWDLSDALGRSHRRGGEAVDMFPGVRLESVRGLSGVLDRRAEEIVVDPVYGRRPPLGVPANADLTRFVENAVAEARGEGPAGRVRASLLSEGSEILGGAGPLADLLVSVESRSPADDAVLREEVYSVFRQRLNGRYGYRVGREGSALWVQRGDGREPGVRLWVGGGTPWGVFLRWSRETLERLRDRVAVLRFGREVETTAEARALVLDALRVDRYTNGPLGDFQRVLLFGEGKGRVAGAALPAVLRGESFRQYIEKLTQRVRGFVGSDDAKSNAAYLEKIRRDGGRPHSLINDALVGLAERGFWGQGAYAFLTVFFVPWVEEWIFRRAVFDSPLIGAALSMVGWGDASWLPLFQWFIAVPVFVLAHRALNKESWPDTLSRVLPALLFTAAYVAAPGEEWNTLLHAFWNGAALVFGRGPTMSVVGGSARPFSTPVLAPPYVEYALAIHRVVNPHNREDFTAVYGGAGADVSNAFPALNPTNAYFISLYPRWLTA
ncbi:MAG TPA: hypothetical protein PLO76_07375, partial [Elusimicrobiota bacterium]|nr:hypothetical protein [Elusimicrobiota bacterium]